MEVSSLRRRDIGLFGALIIGVQLFTNFQTYQSVISEILHIKEEFSGSLVEQERNIASKLELTEMSNKLDTIIEQVISIDKALNTIRVHIEGNFSLMECDPLMSHLSSQKGVSSD